MSVDEYKLIIILSALSLLFFVLLAFVFWVLNKQKGKTQEKFSAGERLVAQRSSQLNQLIKSLDVLMDEVEAAINAAVTKADNKEKRLKELMRQADLKIAKLERLQVKSTLQIPKEKVEKVYSPKPVQEEKNSHKLKGGKFKDVMELIEQGLSHDQVAKKLKIDKGEIELIVNLQKKIS